MIPFDLPKSADIILTGAAGFVGSALAHRCLDEGMTVIGVDNVNDYYDRQLKRDRLGRLTARNGFAFAEFDLADQTATAQLLDLHRAPVVAHLAAQAGVRYSIDNPRAYADSNLLAFTNILEGCRHAKTEHLVYASSSSVYGANKKYPFAENDVVDHPVSFYAATKKANELMAHTYSHLFRLPTTGLRFFTVYGPWGRPDMAYFLFTKAIFAGETIRVFNHGKMKRDFTYIDDIVEGVLRVTRRIPEAGTSASGAPAAVYNIGNDQPVELMTFIQVIERHVGRKAVLDLQPIQPGDVEATWASIDALEAAVGFRPTTSIEHGLGEFVRWYRGYYSC